VSAPADGVPADAAGDGTDSSHDFGWATLAAVRRRQLFGAGAVASMTNGSRATVACPATVSVTTTIAS
jgi:hypothetical protein